MHRFVVALVAGGRDLGGRADVGWAEVRGSWFSGRFCHQIAVMMSDPGNSFFTLIPHCIFRGGAWDLR